MEKPDMLYVLIALLIEKGIIKNIEEFTDFYNNYMEKMEVNISKSN